jgi:hypothetical protein
VLGLAIALLMLIRTQPGPDYLALLAKGWLLVEKGVWVPIGNAATGGGYVPGGLTALVVGLPLELWMDFRAPVVLILFCHVIAYGMLDRLVKETLGSRARVLLAIAYWLNPWQLHQAGWLDNTNYGFLTGAVHLWACYRQRLRPSFLHSTLLVAVVGLSMQLHLNAMLLVIAAVLLWLRGFWKPHWGGVALGSAITLGALIPFFLEWSRHPEIMPASDAPPLSGLLLVWPVIKGILYWFRYASLSVSRTMLAFDFTPTLGASADAILTPLFSFVGHAVGGATVVFPVLANAWAWRRYRTQRGHGTPERMSGRRWLRSYALWVFLSCVIANAMSPASTQYHHNLIAVHAAVLPLVLWVDALLRTRRAAAVRRGIAVYLALSVSLLLAMALANDQYRFAGRDSIGYVPLADHEMVEDLDLSHYPRRRTWPRADRYFVRAYLDRYQIPAGSPAETAPAPDSE